MTLKVKRLHQLVAMPTRGSVSASGLDLRVFMPNTLSPSIEPGQTIAIPTGLAFEVPQGYELQIRPRSGFSLHSGLAVIFGTVDSDYRGEVKIIVTNTSFEDVYVRHNERIAQAVLAPVILCDPLEVEELSETVRASGGFGSTGKA
jgi:dUTP pyrophosphatase